MSDRAPVAISAKDLPVREVKVALDNAADSIPVGRLASRNGRIYFEYDQDFLSHSLDLSPVRLTLEPGVKSFDPNLFEGLPGLFNDSLPDGWGRLLLDRALRAEGVMPDGVGPLERLSLVGETGMGALIYEPDFGPDARNGVEIELDAIAADSAAVMKGAAGDVLQRLIELNGSSAGARPKAMISVDEARAEIRAGEGANEDGFEPWLVKFPNTADGEDAGAVEYVYALMAKAAGVEMAETHLFPAKEGPGYFASKRFDRSSSKRIHAHTASGLLHADHRTPTLDYEDLIALSQMLTRDQRQSEKLFRLAVFNVLSHNRDDHSKNFTFLMDEKGNWQFAPAYDLTFASGPGGEQSSMVMGEGRNPGAKEILRLAESASIEKKKAEDIIEKTRSALSKWRSLATNLGVSNEMIALITERIEK